MTSAQDDQKDRLEILFNEQRMRNAQRNADASTFHQFAQAEADNVQGRFKPWETSKVTGAQPSVDYPRQQSWSNQLANAVPAEPTIDGRDCGDTFGVALGEPHEQFEEGDPLVASSGGAGATVQTTSLSSPSTPLRKRRC